MPTEHQLLVTYVYCEMEAYQNVTLGLIPFYTLNLYIKRLEMIEWKILFLVGAVADPNLGQKRNHLAVTETPAFWTSFAWHEPQISKSLEKKLTETKNIRDHREYHPHNESMLHDVLQWLFGEKRKQKILEITGNITHITKVCCMTYFNGLLIETNQR